MLRMCNASMSKPKCVLNLHGAGTPATRPWNPRERSAGFGQIEEVPRDRRPQEVVWLYEKSSQQALRFELSLRVLLEHHELRVRPVDVELGDVEGAGVAHSISEGAGGHGVTEADVQDVAVFAEADRRAADDRAALERGTPREV